MHSHPRDLDSSRHFSRDGGRHGGRRFAHGGFGMERHFGRGGRERGASRLFEHGDLRYVILQLIADKPQHGYELIRAIEERVAGAYAPSPGVVYPTLTMLEELGYVVPAGSEGTKKRFAVTDEGLAFLEANRPAVTSIFERMGAAGAAMAGGRSPQIQRAIENLRLAVRLRLSRGPLSDQDVQSLVTALDSAARTIEQS